MVPTATRFDSEFTAREIDGVDRALIDVLKFDGRKSFASLGDSVGLTGDAVRERVNRLVSDGIIKITCSLDPRVLGFHTIALIGLKVTGPAEQIAAELAIVPEFDFVVCTAGEYDVFVEAVCTDDLHLLRVVDRHLRSRNDIASLSTYNYLSVVKFVPGGTFGSGRASAEPTLELEEIDIAVVKVLQSDGRASFQEIANEIGIPYQTARRRAKALLESGVVRPETLVNRIVDGTAVVAGVFVHTSRPIAEIAESLLGVEEVEIAAYTTGRTDLVLEVACRDRDHLGYVIGNVLNKIPGIDATETTLYQKVVKLPQSWTGLVRQFR